MFLDLGNKGLSSYFNLPLKYIQNGGNNKFKLNGGNKFKFKLNGDLNEITEIDKIIINEDIDTSTINGTCLLNFKNNFKNIDGINTDFINNSIEWK